MQSLSTPHIELRPNRDGEPRAFISRTRIRVQDIASDHERHGLSADEIAREYPHITLAQVHAALSYYYDHRDEILQQMSADQAFARRLQSESRMTPS